MPNQRRKVQKLLITLDLLLSRILFISSLPRSWLQDSKGFYLISLVRNKQVLSQVDILCGIIVAQESIHSVQNNKTPNMLIKLDIKKAYDRVDWRFLCKCLEAYGFSKQWIDLIFECISTPKMSILVNSTLVGFFQYL